MDSFDEQLIKRQLNKKDYGIFVMTLFAGAVLLFLTLMLSPLLFPIVLIVLCIAIYFIVTSRNLEFEYSVTNGTITIDKVINKQRRKSVISVDARSIESMGKYDSSEHKDNSYKKIYASQKDNNGGWYFTVHHQKFGNVLVVFDPNEKILKDIKPFLRGQVAVNAFIRH